MKAKTSPARRRKQAYIAKESSQIGELKDYEFERFMIVVWSKNRKREFSDRRIERNPPPGKALSASLHRKREFSDRRIERNTRPRDPRGITSPIAKESSQIGELKAVFRVKNYEWDATNRKREFSDRRIESFISMTHCAATHYLSQKRVLR